jgi:hypothetical protein
MTKKTFAAKSLHIAYTLSSFRWAISRLPRYLRDYPENAEPLYINRQADALGFHLIKSKL